MATQPTDAPTPANGPALFAPRLEEDDSDDEVPRGSFYAPPPSFEPSAPVALPEAPADRIAGYGKRGLRFPLGVAWFGVRSFWGHLQHFLASAIATEDIDSRDWMHADPPQKLADRVVSQLIGEPISPPSPGVVRSVTEALGRDLWIDFVADTGDDVSVSEAVGKLFAESYVLPELDGGEVVGRRGDIMLHGGDLAYPVATASEIHDRLIVPFNRALVQRRDGIRRVVMGVPGNHDWYDGLDGFGRVMRRRVGELSREELDPSLELEPGKRLGRPFEWVEKFVLAGHVQKRKALVFDGYVPVQQASYFALPIAPKLDLWGVDRQLRSIDFRQRRHFETWRDKHPDHRKIVLFPDPVYAHLEPSETGMGMVTALELDLERTPHLCLAGDLHHYERRKMDASLHITAGGGGAFLHGARLSRGKNVPPQMEWPGALATKGMLRFAPWHVMIGRAGFLPHLFLLALFAPALGLGLLFSRTDRSVFTATIVAALVTAVICALIGGVRRTGSRVTAALAALLGVWLGLVPIMTSEIFELGVRAVGFRFGPTVDAMIVLIAAVFSGTFAFGAYLAALTAWGLESTQAMTALAHPGFKHFVRMRVRRDGSAVDGWVIGLEEPLAPSFKPVLVDRFRFVPGAMGA